MNAQPTSTPAAAALTDQPEAPRPAATPIDTPRVFIGPEADYYDESWRWMDWVGRKRSWNPSAALGFAGWLAYRRMYRSAAVAFLWLVTAAALIANGVPVIAVALLHLGAAVLLGLYGNTLYFNHFRRLARTVREEDHAARLAALTRLGGTRPAAAAIVAVAALVVIAGTVQLIGIENIRLH
ncbi:MAG TPA: DUF2628 domain-containing protein [Geminicoccaceae bacterium]|nr:DUF2628 domain-containing protein [Geminicoccaceae bacterium]